MELITIVDSRFAHYADQVYAKFVADQTPTASVLIDAKPMYWENPVRILTLVGRDRRTQKRTPRNFLCERLASRLNGVARGRSTETHKFNVILQPHNELDTIRL
jgi:hypothetical protein